MELVEGLVKTHSTPSAFFGSLLLADGQTPDRALAEWHALMISAMVYGFWASLHTQQKVFPVLGAFRPAFLRTISPGCREIFLQIASSREADYVQRISEAFSSKDAQQAIRLSALMAGRVTGQYAEERDEGSSLPGGGDDIAVIGPLWQLVTDNIFNTKQLMDDLQQTVPRLFSDH